METYFPNRYSRKDQVFSPTIREEITKNAGTTIEEEIITKGKGIIITKRRATTIEEEIITKGEGIIRKREMKRKEVVMKSETKGGEMVLIKETTRKTTTSGVGKAVSCMYKNRKTLLLLHLILYIKKLEKSKESKEKERKNKRKRREKENEKKKSRSLKNTHKDLEFF
jgi:hypothetical protein